VYPKQLQLPSSYTYTKTGHPGCDKVKVPKTSWRLHTLAIRRVPRLVPKRTWVSRWKVGSLPCCQEDDPSSTAAFICRSKSQVLTGVASDKDNSSALMVSNADYATGAELLRTQRKRKLRKACKVLVKDGRGTTMPDNLSC
jgi:hypothetical protein